MDQYKSKGSEALTENKTPPPPPCPTLEHEILMPSYRGPFETSEYEFLEKVIYPFFLKALKFYSKELVSGLSEFFRKKINFFLHMIHLTGVECPQNHDYAFQEILRPILLELFPKNGN